MGCASVKKPESSIWLNAFNQKFRYRIKTLQGNNSSSEFIYEDQFDEMPLTALMNLLSFSEKDISHFDSNFISIRNPDTDTFTYKIQRLVGLERDEDLGMEWVVHVNKRVFSWDEVCQKNLKVKPEDNLVFAYQHVDDNKHV